MARNGLKKKRRGRARNSTQDLGFHVRLKEDSKSMVEMGHFPKSSSLLSTEPTTNAYSFTSWQFRVMKCGRFLIFTSLPPVVSTPFGCVRKKGWCLCACRGGWGGGGGWLKQKASEMLSRSDNFRDLRGKLWLRSQDEVTQSAVGFMLGCQPHQRHAATIPLQSFIRAQE